MWGFLTCLNDILVPHLKSIFDLNYTKVMLIQFAFFGAYFLFSIPSAKFIDWIGYQRRWWPDCSRWESAHSCSFPAASVPVLSVVSGSADRSGCRNHLPASRCESLCHCPGKAGDRFEPA